MFNEDEDWSDEEDAQALSKAVLKNTQKNNSSANVKVRNTFSLVTCCKRGTDTVSIPSFNGVYYMALFSCGK